MANCIFCQGNLVKKKINLDCRWKNNLYIIKNIPAEICTQCGEQYFSAKVSKTIDKTIKKHKEVKIGEICVPVLNFKLTEA